MEILIGDQGNVTIMGHVKTSEDNQNIKTTINGIIPNVNILNIYLPDAISIPSYIISYFMDLVCEEELSLRLHVRNNTLYELMDLLNLLQIFNVSKYE